MFGHKVVPAEEYHVPRINPKLVNPLKAEQQRIQKLARAGVPTYLRHRGAHWRMRFAWTLALTTLSLVGYGCKQLVTNKTN